MELRRVIRIVRNWLRLIIASVVLSAASAFLVSQLLPRLYEGHAKLVVGQSLTALNPEYNSILISQRLAQLYAQVATERPLLQRVIDRLTLPLSPGELARRVDVDAPRDREIITITARDGDPAQAARIANTLAEELIAASPTIQGQQAEVQEFLDGEVRDTRRQIEETQAEVDRLSQLPERTTEQDERLAQLQDRLANLRASYATLLQFSSNSSPNRLTLLVAAEPPGAPASPRVLVNTLLAAVVGLLLGLAIAFVVEHLDDTLGSPQEVEESLGLPTLAAIERVKGDAKRSRMYLLQTLLYPRSAVAESFRALRTNIEFASVDSTVRSILITSSVPAEGKTTVAANLGVVFAQAGKSTLLVDADLRRPGLQEIFGLPNSFGLTNLLRSDGLTLEMLAQVTEEPNLRVVTTGPLPPNPAELLGSQRMREILELLKNEVDVVIVDSPPLGAFTDAAILSSRVDGTVLVVGAGRTRRGAVQHGRQALAKAGAHVLGVTLNGVPREARGDYYPYYGPYEAPAGEAAVAEPKPAGAGR